MYENETYINKNDGLQYCIKCNESKEARHTSSLLGADYVRPRLCLCDRERIKHEDEDRENRQQMSRILHDRSVCFHERRMLEWTFDNDDGSVQAMEYARLYVDNWDKMKQEHIGLLLWGDVGVGKTYMAAAIANALLDAGKKVKMTDFAEISNISVFDSAEYVKALISYELLVIDDLGSERKTDFALQNVFDVINRRWESGLPLIVTTNLSLDEIKTFKDEDMMRRRIYDRILEMCKPILISGESKREQSGKYKMDMLRGIFIGAKGELDE